MFSIGFNKDDVDRILRKLNAALEKSRKHKFKWKINLLNRYGKIVATATGSINDPGAIPARGGYPVLDFGDGVSMTGVLHWNALRPYTIKRKVIAKYKLEGKQSPIFPKSISALYSEYGAEVSIWYDTGDTHSNISITDTFAGISSVSNRKKYQLMEEGGSNGIGMVKARPLFSATNFLVMMLLRRACEDPNSALGKAIRKEFVQLVKAQGWGT